ncbi:MAG: hypothetical protein JWN37_119 [Candidatus Nomurabacteria bacterium]|nr:hypothetical protein [Candidatus Nomurabacteria bacterium]
MKKGPQILIGTSGWHYNHWLGLFYPESITGYNELTHFAKHFNTVENNSSFYRISKESTYKTWKSKTPEGFIFSLKLNKIITHINRLKLTDEVKERTIYILNSTQVLESKLGCIVIQLPASFKLDVKLLESYLKFLEKEIKKLKYPPDIAIEFRRKDWFIEKVFTLLRKYNAAIVAAQSSRYPDTREVTADFMYIRMHGPEKLFSSSYTDEQLKEWAKYIKKSSKRLKRAYVYFNNDFHGYAISNAKRLQELLL